MQSIVIDDDVAPIQLRNRCLLMCLAVMLSHMAVQSDAASANAWEPYWNDKDRDRKHNGRSNDRGSETTFHSASCPSFAHPPHNSSHSLPPPFLLTVPQAKVSRWRRREVKAEGKGEKGCWTFITTSHKPSVCTWQSLAFCPQDTLQWLPLGAHVWLQVAAEGEPRPARRAPYLFSSLCLSPCLPLCHSSSFHPLRAGEANVREVLTSFHARKCVWHSSKAKGCLQSALVAQ